MGLDISKGYEFKAQLDAQYQQQMEKAMQVKALIEEKRALKLHQEIQRQMTQMAHDGMGKVTWANGLLSYDHGTGKKMNKIDLYNKFSKLANENNIDLNKETFDSIYNNYRATQNDLWRQSFEYAMATGAREKDVHKLFRSNERFARDFMDIEATGFGTDESEIQKQFDFSKLKPSGSYMRHGNSWMGMGAIPEWMGENPGTTAGIGVGLAGLGYLGRNKLKALAGKIGPGGLGTLGAFAVPSALEAAGAPKEVKYPARIIADSYLLHKAVKGGGGIKGIQNIGKSQINKSIIKSNMDELVKTAKDLNVKVGKKATEESLRKSLIKKVEKQTFNKTSRALASGTSKGILRRLATWGGKTAMRQAGGSAAPGIGNIIMAGWSAADLVSLGFEIFGGPTAEEKDTGISLNREETIEFEKMLRGE